MTDIDIQGQPVSEGGLSVAAVKKHLECRRFPAILTEDDYTEIVEATLRELNRYIPMTKYVSFTTRDGIQDYKIFDTNDTITAGVAAGALEIKDVFWNPGGDWSSLNIFSPGWTMLSQMVLFTGSFFHQPSQMMILRQKLDAFKAQFGSTGFEVIGPCGATESLLRLHPVPRANDNKVVVELGVKLALTDINDALIDNFYMWLEYYIADALANLYATTAGVNLLNFADSKEAMKYWQTKADRYYNKAINVMSGVPGAVMRG
jgi:hypothetical protein